MSITYACTGLPSEAMCTFTAPTSQPNGTITSSLTLATTAASSLSPEPALPEKYLPLRFYLCVLAAALLAVLARVATRLPGRLRWAGIAATIATCLIAAAAGCGGGSGGSSGGGGTNPGTPAGTSTVTVTGTVGSGATAVKQTTAIQLTVQ